MIDCLYQIIMKIDVKLIVILEFFRMTFGHFISVIFILSQSQVYHDKTSYSQFNRENFGDITLCTTRAGSTKEATDAIA